MQQTNKHISLFSILTIILFLLFFINISLGPVTIPIKEVFTSLTSGTASKTTWEYIIINYRLPKAITAILVGIALSISGLLMQTLFRNPLAGPDVLGLSSGSSLGVALIILGTNFIPPFLSPFLLSPYGITVASCLGSLSILLAILIVSQKMKNTMAILITGLMFSSFVNAFVSILTFFSTAQQLQKFSFWNLGSLGNLSWSTIIIITISSSIGLTLSIFSIKPLNALLLGENYAKSLGINLKKTRLIIIIATTILTGTVTAFTGPIAFIGLTVPHISKLIFQTSNHTILFSGTLLSGAIIMLLCDTITQIPGTNFTLPINAITSIIGAPIVIWLLNKEKKLLK